MVFSSVNANLVILLVHYYPVPFIFTCPRLRPRWVFGKNITLFSTRQNSIKILGRGRTPNPMLVLSPTHFTCSDNTSNKILKRIRPTANNTENYWNDVKYVFLSAQLQNYYKNYQTTLNSLPTTLNYVCLSGSLQESLWRVTLLDTVLLSTLV